MSQITILEQAIDFFENRLDSEQVCDLDEQAYILDQFKGLCSSQQQEMQSSFLGKYVPPCTKYLAGNIATSDDVSTKLEVEESNIDWLLSFSKQSVIELTSHIQEMPYTESNFLRVAIDGWSEVS